MEAMEVMKLGVEWIVVDINSTAVFVSVHITCMYEWCHNNFPTQNESFFIILNLFLYSPKV